MNVGTLYLLIKRLHDAGASATNASAVTPPLTLGELVVIGFLIDRTQPVSIREIVKHTGLAQSWVSTVVQSLHKRKWVNVAKAPNDRRSTTVVCKPEIAAETQRSLSRDAMPAVFGLVPHASRTDLKAIEHGLTTLASLLKKGAVSTIGRPSADSCIAWPGARLEKFMKNEA